MGERRDTSTPEPPGAAGRLGTFAGVFTPSILTILGIILFLRLGFVVGAAGLPRALLILGLATLISVLTSLSLSAIATNRKVRGGGDYYLISRSLGAAYGGALGVLLFLAQSISVAFYCAGFGEAVGAVLPAADGTPERLIALGALAALLICAWAGADAALRLQYGVMTILILALGSFFAGAWGHFDAVHLAENWRGGESPLGFWGLYALFFPAVTGFTQGVSMSGDLRDPARSLPVGTFLAVGVSTAVYLATMLAFAGASSPAGLTVDYQAMRRLAAVGGLIDAGVIAATASAALASFLAAPRILQALASDGIFPLLAPFAVTAGPRRNPRRGVLLTGVLAAGTLALGSLNAIAAVVTMGFLLSYALLNYATYVEATGASPSFRPRFRWFSGRASLFGTLICLAGMASIDLTAAAIAIASLAALYQYARRGGVPPQWRDSWHAYRFRRIRDGLLELAQRGREEHDWQPHVLVFTEDAERRPRLLRFAGWMAVGTGLITAVQLVEGDGTQASTQRRCAALRQALEAELEHENLDAFPLVVAASDLAIGAAATVQAWGVGPLQANTVLLNLVESPGLASDRRAGWEYARVLRSGLLLQRHIVVLDADAPEFEQLAGLAPPARRIDVWWRDDPSSRLSLLFAYLMTRTDFWNDARIRLLAAGAAADAAQIEGAIRARLDEIRIDAELVLLDGGDSATLVERSRESAVVFLPLRLAGARLTDPFGTAVQELLPALPIVAMVGAAGDVALVEPPPAEDGDDGEQAATAQS